jgi:hypothetical protein
MGWDLPILFKRIPGERMKPIKAALALPLLFLFSAQTAGDLPVNLHETMKGVVAPQAQELWDVGNRAMDDEGKADASKIRTADWTKLAGAAQKMKDAAAKLANAQRIVTAAPGAKLQDDGTPGASTAQMIQTRIDGDRKAFADHAKQLELISEEFLAAAKGRDAVKLTAASGRMDEVCEACHVQYWYPDQAGK